MENLNIVSHSDDNIDINIIELDNSYIVKINYINKEFFNNDHIVNEFGNRLKIVASDRSYYDDYTIYLDSYGYSYPIVIKKSLFNIIDDKHTSLALINTFKKISSWHGFNDSKTYSDDNITIEYYDNIIIIDDFTKYEDMIKRYKVKVYYHNEKYYILIYEKVKQFLDDLINESQHIKEIKIMEINNFKKYMEIT